MNKYLIIILCLAVNILTLGQVDNAIEEFADSLATISDPIAAKDTLITKKKFDVDDVVYAKSTDSLKFDVLGKMMFVYGDGSLKYKNSNLAAGKIDVDFQTNQLAAKGIIDSSDSTSKIIQTPSLSENGQTYEGTSLKYNFKTQQGFISLARNEEETSRYEGKKVKKVDKNTFFIKDGIYTTCDLDIPHFYFSADKMKVKQNDKVFAKWIFLHIAGIPLPIPVPWAVFPNKTGRRSGLIVPSYGQMAERGQYFRNFGYFWAMNDYMDLALTADFYSKGGWGLRSRYRYALRYNFTGNVQAGISRITSGESSDPNYSDRLEWNFKIYHSQTINPTTRLNINLQYLTSNYLNNNGVDYNDLLRQDIVSNATFSKRWENGWSMQLNYNRNQNLKSGDISETLPKVTFTKGIFYPFKSKTKSAGGRSKWYEKIGVQYDGRAENRRTKISGEVDSKYGAQHNLRISASPKVGYFNVSPQLSYTEKWYPKRRTFDVYRVEETSSNLDGSSSTTYKDSVAERDINQWSFVRSFNTSVSASTKLYGMAQPKAFGIDAFRHTLTPSISYNYSPDFSQPGWGYYDSYEANGETVTYDKFSNGIYGGTSAGESQSVNFSVGNLFEIKTMKDPTDTTSKSHKVRLMNFNVSSGYNFAADSLKLRNLSLTYRTQIGQWLNFNGSSSYSFYDQVNGRAINTFLSDAGKGFIRLTNLNLALSTTLSGEKLKGEKRPKSSSFEEEKFSEDYSQFARGEDVGLMNDQPVDFSIPWTLSLNYNFNLNKSNPANPTRTQNIGVNFGFNLTKNWKFTFRGNYDIEKKLVSAPAITIYRDLHCWEMNFSWYPIGAYRGFRMELRIKAPELHDIKIEKADGLYSGR